MKSPSKQFAVMVRDEAGHRQLVTNVGYRVLLGDVQRPKRARSGTTLTVAMALIGLLAGWIAGIALTGGFHNSRSIPDSPADVAIPSQPAVIDAQSGERVATPATKPVRSREARADSQESPDTDTDVKKAEDKPAEKEAVEAPVKEPSKEIGRAAMDKILKENEKAKRGKLKDNKNEE